jgi:hypothetical protein
MFLFAAVGTAICKDDTMKQERVVSIPNKGNNHSKVTVYYFFLTTVLSFKYLSFLCVFGRPFFLYY